MGSLTTICKIKQYRQTSVLKDLNCKNSHLHIKTASTHLEKKMGKLSTHVLDTMHGRAAAGMYFELYRIDETERILLRQLHTNEDGRSERALLTEDEMQAGIYELIFHAGNYFSAYDINLVQPCFIDQVVLRFGIANPEQNYHVPLIVTPWSYSTYRGS